MQDNENFENNYDDYEDSYHESKFNNPTLYFLDGDYKITLNSKKNKKNKNRNIFNGCLYG